MKKINFIVQNTANCRDVKGKGERDYHMMLYNWWLYEPNCILFA